MTKTEELVAKQREYFRSGVTLPCRFRCEMLDRLYHVIRMSESEIEAALQADLGKNRFEAYTTEVGFALSEISYLRRHLPRMMRPKRVCTDLSNLPGRSRIVPEPYGNVLVMSPWNYPFQLSISPLAGAIAAGNTVVLKPSNYSINTSRLLSRLIREIFPPEYITVVEGDRYVNQDLLDAHFDYIFFTGSTRVGRVVMAKAAAHLTPVSLELGGKSPCIIDPTAQLDLAARRIAWGKCLNSGQTCVAPDYALVHRSVVEPFISALKRAFVMQVGEHAELNPDYPRIINRKKFDRLRDMITASDVLWGGAVSEETLRIAPCIVRGDWDSAAMGEEIFGPIFPILIYDSLDEVIREVTDRPRPLALYLFTEDRRVEREVISRIPFGGGCVNDTIMHLASSQMPFGGVGESGMGGYHGRFSFETFSHRKSILHKATWLDLPVRYGRNIERDLRLVRLMLR